MNSLLNKIISIIKSFANNEEILSSDYKREDVDLLHEIVQGFEFLVCYPQDNVFDNVEINDDIIKKCKILKYIYLNGSEELNQAIKDDENLRKFIDGNGEYEVDESCIDKKHYYYFYDTYEKRGDFIYKYTVFKSNEWQDNRIVKTYGNSNKKVFCQVEFSLPMIVPAELKDEVPSELILSIEDNIYRFNTYVFKECANVRKAALSSNAFKGNLIQRLWYVDKYLMNDKGGLEYILIGDKLIFKDMYLHKDYESFVKVKNNLSKFLIIDKLGNEIDVNNIDSSRLLHDIRVGIAHINNKFNYNVKSELENDIKGKVFLLGNKAVLLPYNLYSTLSHLMKFNYNEVEDVRYNFYCPKITKAIVNENELREYLNQCKKITISNINNIDLKQLDFLINSLVEKYKKESVDARNLKAFIEQNKNTMKDFKKIRIEVEELESIDLMVQKIMLNPYFSDNQKLEKENQEECVNFIIQDFYYFDIVKKNALLPNGRTSDILINNKALPVVMDNVVKALENPLNLKKIDPKFGKYRDELYIALCIFLGYVNLIYNSFDDDIDETKSSLPKEEIDKLVESLKPEMFKGFDFVNLNKRGDDRHSSITTVKAMKSVISIVRNKIAHFDVRVRFSKSGKPEDNFLIFNYEHSPNLYYKITCKDFIDFIMNPLFLNYRDIKGKNIDADTYDDLIQEVLNKIKKSVQ